MSTITLRIEIPENDELVISDSPPMNAPKSVQHMQFTWDDVQIKTPISLH